MRCAGFVPPALRVRWRACAGENCQDSYMYRCTAFSLRALLGYLI